MYLQTFISRIFRFLSDKGGNIAITMAISAPALLGGAGLAFDYYALEQQKSKLQSVADAAALASVKELTIAVSGNDSAVEVAKQFSEAQFETGTTSGNLEAEAVLLENKDGIQVDLSFRWTPFFAQYFDSGVTPIKVSATAKLAGDALTCVIGLMQPQTLAKSAIHLDDRSQLLADGCGVVSNSEHRWGLRADDNARIEAESICTAGGVIELGSASFTPEPLTDCPKIDDPLAGRVAPSTSGCDYRDLTVSEDAKLKPGVYCGGLRVDGVANVTLEPGIYVIKDGPLMVMDESHLTGEGVGFYMTGDNSIFDFQEKTEIDLSAPETGTLAGLLFFEDKDVPYSFEFNPLFLSRIPPEVRLPKISSNNARNLLGTIYMPRSVLLINSNAPVADTSAYTAIVVGRLWLQEGPILTLNAKYSETRVPVPNGLVGTTPILVK